MLAQGAQLLGETGHHHQAFLGRRVDGVVLTGVNHARGVRTSLLRAGILVAEGREIAARASDASMLEIERASHTFNAIHPLIHVPFELDLAAEVSTHFITAYD